MRCEPPSVRESTPEERRFGLLVLEGVTGAGKSTVIEHLVRRLPRLVVVPEEETFGESLERSRQPGFLDAPTFPELDVVLSRVSRLPRPCVIERFHLSQVAACGVAFGAVDRFDEALARLGAVHVLLLVHEASLVSRAIDRQEREGWAAGMAAFYGSRELAIAAAARSQAARRDAVRRSRLAFVEIDTTARAWEGYATRLERVLETGAQFEG